MKKLIKTTWKHVVIAFVLHLSILLIFNIFDGFSLFDQIISSIVFWFIVNLVFEIYQARGYTSKTINKEILYDSLGASFGALIATIIVNL